MTAALSSWPLITDPLFYAAAVPGAFLIGLSKSGLASGIGALAVPLLALTQPVPTAAAILLPLLMAADLMGLKTLMRHADWPLVRRLLPAALVGVLVGALLFRQLPAAAVAFVLGLITLTFLAIRLFVKPKGDAPPPSNIKGYVLGGLSGFTSFIAHAGSPPIAFYLMPLKLKPLVYSATVSVLFAAINFSKWLPYAALGLIDTRNMLTSLVLLPIPLLGVWLGVRWVGHVSPVFFTRLLLLGMGITGSKLLWDGVSGLLR